MPVTEINKKRKVSEPQMKPSPIGMIPKEWLLVPLDTVAIRGTGHTPDKKKPFYYHGGIKWVSLADSNKLDDVYISDTKITLSQAGIDNSSAVIHPKGTVLLSRDAGVGKSAIMTDEMAVSQHFVTWKCSNELHNLFLYFYLQHLKPEFERIAIGSTIKTIGMPYFRNFKVVLPEITEQIRISNVLLSIDRSIRILNKIITAKEKCKRVLMRLLLTRKTRFKEFEKDQWTELLLSNLFSRVTRKNNLKSTNVLTISAQRGLVNQENFFNKQVASQVLDNYYLLQRDEFAYNKSYSNGYPMGAVKRLKHFDSGVVTTLYICFRLTEPSKHSVDFFEHYFEAGILNRGLEKIAHEGGRAHGLLNVTATDFFNLKVSVPRLKEQRKIASVLSACDAEIQNLKQQLENLKKQKKGLMQLLLTGKVRVKV